MQLIQLMAAIGAGTGVKEGDRISLSNHSVTASDSSGSPWVYTAGFVVRSDGKLDLFLVGDEGPPTDPAAEWVVGYPDSTYAADYEVFASEFSFVGPATRTGTMDTWIDCSTANTNRTWELDKTSAGGAIWVIDVDIRHKTSQVVYGSGRITLTLDDAFS